MEMVAMLLTATKRKTKWKMRLQKDVIPTKKLDEYGSCMYYEYYYIMARRGVQIYLYHWRFNIESLAKEHLKKILAVENFSPKRAAPGKWYRIRDGKPVTPSERRRDRKLDWENYLDLLDKACGGCVGKKEEGLRKMGRWKG